MVNAALPPTSRSGPSVPPLKTAESDSEIARLDAIAAVESYKLSMRAHHEPLSNSAKVLVERAKADKADAVLMAQLESRVTNTLKLV